MKPIGYLKTQDGRQFHVSCQKRQENIIVFQSKLEIQECVTVRGHVDPAFCFSCFGVFLNYDL